MSYDQEEEMAFKTLSDQLKNTSLNILDLRRFNSIKNAIEIQIEEGYSGSEAIIHLIKALHAVANTYSKLDADIMTAAIMQMERSVMRKK